MSTLDEKLRALHDQQCCEHDWDLCNDCGNWSLIRTAATLGADDALERVAAMFDRQAAAWGDRCGRFIPEHYAEQIRALKSSTTPRPEGG